MLVFSRTTTELVKSILYTLSGGLLGFFIASIFEWPIWARILCTAGLMVVLLILLVLGEALRIEIDEDGTMRVYTMNRLRRELRLSGIELSIPTISEKRRFRPLPNMILHISDPSGGKTYKLDCAPLGLRQYQELCERLRMTMQVVDKQKADD